MKNTTSHSFSLALGTMKAMNMHVMKKTPAGPSLKILKKCVTSIGTATTPKKPSEFTLKVTRRTGTMDRTSTGMTGELILT